MRIYILPIPDAAQPATQKYRYPRGNDDYEIEQQFFDWMSEHPELITSDPRAADLHYLPVFWTRYHVDHDYAQSGRQALQEMVGASIRDDAKTFTICQYDDGPLIDIGRTITFLASRKSDVGIDIPLLRAPHRLPWWKPAKRYLASFAGRLATHPLRQAMAEAARDRADILIHDGLWKVRRFVRTTLASYACLSPRGYGGSSFRTFEAMQLGVAPFVIGDRDTRPFRKFIDWGSCSLFTGDPRQVPAMLDDCGATELIAMSRRAKEVYETHLGNRRWCRYVIEELKVRA